MIIRIKTENCIDVIKNCKYISNDLDEKIIYVEYIDYCSRPCSRTYKNAKEYEIISLYDENNKE